MLFPFSTSDDASFSCDLDFSRNRNANFFFYSEGKETIPLHISMRPESGIIVLNSDDGNGWQQEQTTAFDDAKGCRKLELSFTGDGTCELLLNGQAVHKLDQIRFPRLADITLATFDGSVLPETLVIAGSANETRTGEGSFQLRDGATLSGWAFDPAMTRQKHSLEVVESQTFIQAQTFADAAAAKANASPTENIGFAVDVPGRIWIGAGKELTLRVRSNAIPCGEPLKITHDQIVLAAEREAATADMENRSFATLLLMEHLRFADLMPRLSSHARSHFIAAADLYKLRKFLIGDEQTVAPLPKAQNLPAFPAPGSTDLLLDYARKQFAETMRADAGQDAAEVLRDIVDRLGLSRSIRQTLFLEMGEYFCLREEFEKLHFLAASNGLSYKRGDNLWHNSAVLPFLFMQGDLNGIVDLIYDFVNRDGWLTTSALAWTMRHIVAPAAPGRHTIDEKLRENAIYAFMALVDTKIAPNYWSSLACTAMTKAAVTLIVQLPTMPDYLQKDIEEFVVRNYALSPLFWRLIDAEEAAGQFVRHSRIATSRQLFATIADHARRQPREIQQALRFFERMKCPQIARFKLELLGPTGIATTQDQKASFDRLLQESEDGFEIALRALASPLGVEASEDMARAVRRTIPKRYANVPKSPYYRLQIEMSRLARAMKTDIRNGDLDKAREALPKLLHGLEIIACSRSMHVGIWLGVRMFERMLAHGAIDMAEMMMAFIDRSIGLHRAVLAENPGLRSAAGSLVEAERRSPHPLRASVIALLSPLFANLSMKGVPEGEMRSDGLFDTVVVVMSCRPYMDTRIAAIREGWLRHLQDFGIPYVIAIGQEANDKQTGQRHVAGVVEGDVLVLDAPDDYEGLPQKTLKAVEWVSTQTAYSHMLKIDDDCFLNVAEFFDSLSYVKSHYYGRKLTRVRGQMDRMWHCEKSQSARGRFEIDKSPEPSVYADGGSGYTLSRHAMRQVLTAARSAEGQKLIAQSFMEDKMIGDLLSFGKIVVNEEDYYVSIRRRTYSKAIPVSLWTNSFFPSRAAACKLIHLDTDKDQALATRHLSQTGMLPKKIWPSYTNCTLVYNSNALEMISHQSKLALNDAKLAVVACMRNEMFMLPHFLAHYRKLGVECFIIADNCSDDGTLEYLEAQPDTIVFSVDTDYGNSNYGVAWQQALLSTFRVNRWSLLADADEMLVYRGGADRPILRMAEDLDAEGADAARIFMLDMYPAGPLSDATFKSGDIFAEAGQVDRDPFLSRTLGTGPYCDAPTWTSALRHRLIPNSHAGLFVAQKIALLKYQPWMRLSAGLHYVAETRLSREEMLFAHFKYHADFRAKAVNEVSRGQHFNNAQEYRKYLALLSEGRDIVFDPAVSVPWREAPFVKSILG